MSWLRNSIRIAVVLAAIALSGCVTTPAYRYVVDVGGDYYYDERPVVTSAVVLPAYGAFGYSSPGGWYGSVGFGFGTYYGLGGYYGPSWGAFGPRYGYAGYWRPPYYYKPRYSRPHHYYRPPYRHARPLPWRHDSANAWHRPGQHDRNWNDGHTPGNRPWRGQDNRGTEPPRGHRIRVGAPSPGRGHARDRTIQLGPGAPPQRVRHAIAPPTRQPVSPAAPPRQPVRADRGGAARVAATVPAQRPVETAHMPARRATSTPRALPRPGSAAPPRHTAPTPAAQPRPMSQARPAPVQSRPAPAMRPAPAPAPRSSGGGGSRRGGSGAPQRHR